MKPKENKYYIFWDDEDFRIYYITSVEDNPNFEKEENESAFSRGFKYYISGKILCGFDMISKEPVWWGDEFNWDDGYGDIEDMMYDGKFGTSTIMKEFDFSKEELSKVMSRIFS